MTQSNTHDMFRLSMEQRSKMIEIYFECGKNDEKSAQIFNDMFPGKIVWRGTVYRIIKKWRGINSIEDRVRNHIKPVTEGVCAQDVLHHIQQNAKTTSRCLASECQISTSSVNWILTRNGYRPFKPTTVQILDDGDPARRMTFCSWFLDHGDIRLTCFTDEAVFPLVGNYTQTRIWATENPLETNPRRTVHIPKLMVWAGIMGTRLFGPYFFERNVNDLMKWVVLVIFISLIYILVHAMNESTKPETRLKELSAETAELIFVGGHQSSGTGLMRVMLDAHPKIRCGAEPMITTHILINRHRMPHAEKLRAIAAGVYPMAYDKAVAAFIFNVIKYMGPSSEWLCHKEPRTFFYLDYLGQIFPQSKFIHILRDGRAAIVSSKERNLARNSQETMLKNWERIVTKMLIDCQNIGPRRCLTVYYEKLILKPEEESRRIFNFLGIPWDPIVLHHETVLRNVTQLIKYEPSTKQFMRAIHTDSLAKWARSDSILSQDFIRTAGANSAVLTKLGYSDCGVPPNYDRLPSSVPHIQ